MQGEAGVEAVAGLIPSGEAVAVEDLPQVGFLIRRGLKPGKPLKHLYPRCSLFAHPVSFHWSI